VGVRLRVRPSVYVIGEAMPRLVGYRPGASHMTLAQMARRTANYSEWYLGFDISRKFY
jgi:hypothetical protein